jgi:putative transposase
VSVASGTVQVMAADTSTRPGAVRVRLGVSNGQRQQLLSAAGARRYAYNWALARIVANHAQWQTEPSDDIAKNQRTRPFSCFDLVQQWDASWVPWGKMAR